MLKALTALFKRRPASAPATPAAPVDIMERTHEALAQQRAHHDSERAAFEALAAYYDEAARQHREASAAIGEALQVLDLSDALNAPHVALAVEMQGDIEAAQRAAVKIGMGTTYGKINNPDGIASTPRRSITPDRRDAWPVPRDPDGGLLP